MGKISKKKKYDLIIYSCLFMALVLISISGISSLDTTSYSLKELLFPEEEIVEIEEPLELKQIDKKELVDNYILDLLDEIKKDQILTSEILRSWQSYEILNVLYDREITKNYHSYIIEIKINNKDALLPVDPNKKISTNEYNVISLKINVLKDEITKEYSIKSIDIPKNG